MSGVVHEPRLERLLKLRARLDKEIADERAAEKTRARKQARSRAQSEAERQQRRRDAVSAREVRAWAFQYGHPFPQRGKVPADLIDQYLDAHPEQARRVR